MPRHQPEACPRAAKPTLVLVVYGAVLVMGAVFGGIALTQLRSTTAQLDAVISKSAWMVIEVERLHAGNDHLGMATRGYLLTQNPSLLIESRAQARDFRERLDALASQVEGGHAAQALARIREQDARGQEQMERLFADVAHMSERDIAGVVEQRSQLLRDRIGSELEALSRAQEAVFHAAKREAKVAVTHAMQILGTLAVVALVLATALTVALVRTLRLVARGRVALEASHARLAHANQELDAFAGRTAHDLRNMIAPLGLLAETLVQDPTDTATVHRAAARLQRLTSNADGLIGALLDFARAGGQPPAVSESAPVAEVIREVMADLASLTSTQRASVQVEAEEIAVRCSRSLLHTVLMNLVGNALKYLDGGSMRVVRVSAVCAGMSCELTVADTGPGIPADALGSIFEPFYRAPGVTTAGTGIGLATVSRIVESHHGHISVQSRVGEGSNFVVRLPIAAPAAKR